MLDLHAHSRASDGSLTPTELVNLAEKIKLKAVALTDHDSVDGIEEALLAARDLSVELVPGVELSAKMEKRSMHIVGLYVDYQNTVFNETIDKVRVMRNNRNPKLSARLTEIGMPVSLEEAEEAAGGDIVGRPHFAKVMLSKGYVNSIHEAFQKHLGSDGNAMVHKERLDPAEAIRAIRIAGGVPVLAHPDQTGKSGEALEHLVADLKDMGLEGIEAFYPSFTTSQTHEYTKLAKRFDLVRSGGSDFHGDPKPKIRLGRGFGSLYVPDDLLEHIKKRSSKIASST